jgi:hypothetical protein
VSKSLTDRARELHVGENGPELMTTRRMAAITWGLCLLLAIGALVLLALGAGEDTGAGSSTLSGVGGLGFVAASLAFATVGAVVATRVPENPIGWIFCLTGLMLAVAVCGAEYADQMLFIASDALPGGRTAAWLQEVAFVPTFGLLGLALLLFPNGRLPSRRWRPVVWLALAGMTLSFIGAALRPGPLTEPFTRVTNPAGITGLRGLMDTALGFGFVFGMASVALAALGLPARLRRSSGVEREQLKWLALAAAIAGLGLVADIALYIAAEIDVGGAAVLGLAFTLFPVAAGAAILRYRLFDIDVVINRALVYGALTATLAGAYLGSVLLLQLVLSPSSDLAIAGSTLAVAALFGPARARVQAAVDHRFYRRKYDAQVTLGAFAARLRDEVDLDHLSAELVSAAHHTLQPAHASLWLRQDVPR